MKPIYLKLDYQPAHREPCSDSSGDVPSFSNLTESSAVKDFHKVDGRGGARSDQLAVRILTGHRVPAVQHLCRERAQRDCPVHPALPEKRKQPHPT